MHSDDFYGQFRGNVTDTHLPIDHFLCIDTIYEPKAIQN